MGTYLDKSVYIDEKGNQFEVLAGDVADILAAKKLDYARRAAGRVDRSGDSRFGRVPGGQKVTLTAFLLVQKSALSQPSGRGKRA